MALLITSLYVGVLGILANALAFIAGTTRGRMKISVGHGGNPQLLVAMRRHSNFVEHVPIILIMFALLESNGSSPVLLHALGLALVVARLLHAIGIKEDAKSLQSPVRIAGAAITFWVALISAGNLLYQYVGH